MSELTRYPSYKDSGVPWLGEIPSHWHIKRLKFAISNISQKVDAQSSSLRYFGLENIESFTGKLLNKIELTSQGVAHQFEKNDVLFGKLRPYLAKVYLAKTEGLSSTEALIFRPSSDIDPEFLFYYCLSQDFINEVNGTTFGSKMPRANWDNISSLLTVFPCLDEQKIIASFLNEQLTKIDAIIYKQKLLLKKLSEQRQSIITHTVTRGLNPNAAFKYSSIEWLGNIPEHWDVKSSRYVLSQVGSGKTPKGGAEVYTDEGVILIRSQNVHDDGLRLNDVAHITDEADNQQSNSRVLPDDVLLNITGASIGRANIVPKTFPRANVNQHVCILRPIEDSIHPKFLLFLLQSTYSNALIQAEQNGTSREGINFEQIRSFKYPIPPLEEQEQIIGYLNTEIAKIEKMTNATKKIISSLKEYRSTLITQAVTGKIDVRQFEDNQKGAA